jgi:hypothetical protein
LLYVNPSTPGPPEFQYPPEYLAFLKAKQQKEKEQEARAKAAELLRDNPELLKALVEELKAQKPAP